MSAEVSRVFRVTRDNAAEAGEALAMAFQNEPATDFFFPPSEGDKLGKLRALFGWAMEYRVRLDIPALAVFAKDERRIAGAATLRIPKMPDDMGLAEELWGDMESVFGAKALERFDRYEAGQKKHLKQEPHHYLVAIGVHPDFQGQGYGGELLKAAIDLAEADEDSIGIGLDTGSESNQKFYEKYGFELVATEPLDEKVMRLMFRPNTRSRR